MALPVAGAEATALLRQLIAEYAERYAIDYGMGVLDAAQDGAGAGDVRLTLASKLEEPAALLSLLCFVLGDQLAERLSSLLPEGGIASNERRARLKEIDAELLSIERAEESLIRELEAAGFSGERRLDASSSVLLED